MRGRVGCGFLALPVKPEPETVFLMRDPLMAILPEDHPFQDLEALPVKALCTESFLLPEKGSKAEISGIFEHSRLTSHVPITTWGNYAILSMAESGLGISVLPQLVLRRIPYRAAIRPLSPPAYRDIVPALHSKKSTPLAAKRFIDGLPFRSPAAWIKGKPFISPVRSSFS